MTEVKTEVVLGDADRARLRAIFGSTDDAALDIKLGAIARAALQEHLDMYFGTGAFSKGSDFREHRLAMLALHAFDGTIPSESTVSRMFQITRTASRSLLKAMLSKYQILLEDALNKSLRELLDGADKSGDDRHIVTCDSPALIGELNQRLIGMTQAFPPITPQTDQAGRYSVDNASLDALRKTV